MAESQAPRASLGPRHRRNHYPNVKNLRFSLGLLARLTVRGDVGTLPSTVKAAGYFVASEAVHNAVQHGQASEFTIDLRLASKGTVVEVVITDNGSGGAKLTPGGGLAGLRDRTGALGGGITIDSPVDGPTVVRATIPCAFCSLTIPRCSGDPGRGSRAPARPSDPRHPHATWIHRRRAARGDRGDLRLDEDRRRRPQAALDRHTKEPAVGHPHRGNLQPRPDG